MTGLGAVVNEVEAAELDAVAPPADELDVTVVAVEVDAVVVAG